MPVPMEGPQPQSNPGTPSEIPGTPTSTTTSLSALSTTAIKDGQRGQPLSGLSHRGHQHHSSANSLEAERADRISRLAGLSSVSTLRAAAAATASPPDILYTAAPGAGTGATPHHASAQTTPTSTGFPPHIAAHAAGPAPAYFDAAGQPVAITKISTVGAASATESVSGRTTTETGTGAGDQDLADPDPDEDMLSTDTNLRSTELDSASGYLGTGPSGDIDPMDEDLANRSVGGFEDRMSDDGSASLVGFGEGAGSTVSGPIYHRRPLPGPGASSSPGPGAGVRQLERSSSGLSDAFGWPGRRDTVRGLSAHEGGGGGDTPVSASAALERRDARMVDGIATDGTPDDGHNGYIDTTTRAPVPVQANTSAIRETQRPHSHQQQAQAHLPSHASREAVERIVSERLDNGERGLRSNTLGSPRDDGRLGRFYFEDSR